MSQPVYRFCRMIGISTRILMRTTRWCGLAKKPGMKHHIALILVAAAAFSTGCSLFKNSQSYDDARAFKAPHYMGEAPRTAGTVLIAPVTFDTESDLGFEALTDSIMHFYQAYGSTFEGTVPARGSARLFAGVPGPWDHMEPIADRYRQYPDRDPQLLRLHQGTSAWRAAIREQLEAAGADYLFIARINVGRYYPSQVDWKGTKVFEVGTGYRPELPWLTALDEPMELVQITGMLVDRRGRVVRAGTEGILPLRTPFAASVVGLSRTAVDADLDRALAMRRNDLPHAPTVWQAAAHNLYAQLVGQEVGLWMARN